MRRILMIAGACWLLAVPTAGAQGPRGADTLSAAAVAESLKVLRDLEQRTQANAKDAASWFRLGMIAWALNDRAHAPNPPSTLDATRLGRQADNGLRMAAETSTNAYYRMMVGRFLLGSGNTITRTAATGQFSAALDMARANHDTVGLAESAIEYGRVYWRRYDALNHRRLLTSGIDVGRSISDAMQPAAKAADAMAAVAAAEGQSAGGYDGGLPQTSMKDVRQLIDNVTLALPADVNGAADYQRASELFYEAYAAAPTNPRTFRSVAMVLADSSRWRELESFAQTHLKGLPWDPAGWLALGLAQHRMGKSKAAGAAFDSAFAYLTPQERGRLDRLERVLRPSDTTRIARSTASDHTALARMYWLFADPLWSREGNESRIEFLARVEFAELRWTVDELGYRGAETDRGDIYIRYGPPDIIAAMSPGVNIDSNDIVTYWLYKSGLMFAFSGMATYASAHTAYADQAMVEAIKIAQPVRWDNIADVVQVDSMPVQVARFRGAHDSVDVVFAAKANIAAITKDSDVQESVRNAFWLLLGGTTAVYFDTSKADPSGMKSWTRRLAPGNYVYRIETTAASSKRAGRATSQVATTADLKSGFATQGFGLSDLLLATSTDASGSPAGRWTAMHPAPLAGAVARRSQMSIVWENYDFGARNNSVEYTVALSLVKDKSASGRVTASIVGRLAGLARTTQQQDDRVTQTFDRTAPASTAFADEIDLALGETPIGTYTLTLEITDKVSGKKTTRTASLVIR